MTDRRTPTSDQFLTAWFEDGPTRMPDRVLDVVVDRIGGQRQRPSWRFLGRPQMPTYARLAAAAAALVLVAVAGYMLLPRTGFGPGATPVAPSPKPTAAPTVAPTIFDALRGTWTSAASTCADQNAALTRAGYTAAQLELAGWDASTCTDTSIGTTPLTHGSVHELRFNNGGGLVELADGSLGWSGFYRLADAGTFVAGDQGRDPYITYTFTVDGDTLVIDMVTDEIQGLTEQQRWSDIVAQTVIYESGPFTRTP